jgi:hypothetical protein
MCSAERGHLTVAHYLLEQKADVHYRISKESDFKNKDALHFAMSKTATERTRGAAFAFLSCNTDAKNVVIDVRSNATTTIRDIHIATYKQVQAYIDEFHDILKPVLTEHVQVDACMGRGDNDIYQEPMERVLEYLGMSMSKDQVVNTSIDGGEEEGAKRALLPSHLLNANHWFDKYTTSR